MMKKLLIAFAVLLVILIVGAYAVFSHFDSEYGIRQAPMLSYMEFGGANSDITIRLAPNEARSLIVDIVSQQFGDSSNDFITNLIADSLPHEIVLMASPRYSDQTIDLTLYVNERRGGPVLARELTNLLASSAGAETISWNPEGARLEQRGVVRLTGETRLHNQTLSDIDRRWGANLPAAPQLLDGGNLLEVVAMNRKGSLYALIAALAIPDPNQSNVAVVFALEEVKLLDAMRITANFISDDEAAISMLLQCDRAIEYDRPESMRLMLDQVVVPQLATFLEENYGMELTGGFVRNGYDLEGAFTLSNIKPLLSQSVTAK